jgi:DDE superfamily endonuclease
LGLFFPPNSKNIKNIIFHIFTAFDLTFLFSFTCAMAPKFDNTLRQESILAALNFLETQKENSEKQLSLRRVALEHGIAPQTLRDAVARGRVADRPGPPTVLTAEEERELVGYCLNMQKLGFGLTKAAVNTMVMKIIQEQHRQHSFKDGPGKKWWERFMRDHQELSFRVPQELTSARAAKGNPVVIQNHFTELQKIIRDRSLTAERIWNMDECGFNISSRLQKVLAQKNSRQVHKIVPGNSHEHISVCPTISAAGMFIPPLLVYKGSRVIEGLLSGESVPSGTVAAFTDTGYMHENIFRMYIEHFSRSIPPARPVMLMLDGHASHIDLVSINFCRDNDILLYVLPSNTTHILQPSEIPFKKLKLEFDKASDRYRMNNDLKVVTKYSFAQVFGKAFHETYTPVAIKKAYAATGIWPLDPSVIKFDRLMPSLPTEAPLPPPPETRATRSTKMTRLLSSNARLRNSRSASLDSNVLGRCR